MTKRKITISANKLFAIWHKDAKYQRAYNEVAAEFAMAAALIQASIQAGLMHEQLPKHNSASQI